MSCWRATQEDSQVESKEPSAHIKKMQITDFISRYILYTDSVPFLQKKTQKGCGQKGTRHMSKEQLMFL